MHKLVAVAGAALFAVGCSSSEPGDSAPVDLDTVYMQTLVELSPEGARVVAQQPITLRQQIALRDNLLLPKQRAGIGVDSITQDTLCSSSNLNVWSGNNGTGNQICFQGTGDAALNDYMLDGTTSWAGRVRSWRPANHSGWWYHGTTTCSNQLIVANTNVGVADSCVVNADHLHLST